MTVDFASRMRSEDNDSSVAIPCVVVGIDLSGDPMVTVKPQMSVPADLLNGETDSSAPLEIEEVPYAYASGPSFAMFIPPEIGMQGYLVVTDGEVADIEKGVAQSARRKDRRSGFFVPAGNRTGSPFKGNPLWAELRTLNCRVAASSDMVHLQAGTTEVMVSTSGFDVLVNGVSLIAALKQMSTHIRALETLVHGDGDTHGGAQTRLVDNIAAATSPSRAETGVR